jgi:hypothetical protein
MIPKSKALLNALFINVLKLSTSKQDTVVGHAASWHPYGAQKAVLGGAEAPRGAPRALNTVYKYRY